MKRRILVVEDDADISLLMQIALEDGGYEVVVKHDGREALEYVKNSPKAGKPELILLDYYLPRMSGAEITMELGDESSIIKDIPIIFTSALTESDIKMRLAGMENVKGFLQKPVNMEKLLHSVKCMLGE